MMPDKERYTNPVVNIVQHDHACMREYLERMIYQDGLYEKIRQMDKSLVEAHKEAFGRQTYCWSGEFRHWVWDFGKWRVYVSDKKGIGIEVEPDVELEETMAILREYWQKFGA